MSALPTVLVALFCIVGAEPEKCEPVRFVIGPQCVASSIPILAEYSGDHPELRLERFHCANASEAASIR